MVGSPSEVPDEDKFYLLQTLVIVFLNVFVVSVVGQVRLSHLPSIKHLFCSCSTEWST